MTVLWCSTKHKVSLRGPIWGYERWRIYKVIFHQECGYGKPQVAHSYSPEVEASWYTMPQQRLLGKDTHRSHFGLRCF